MHSYLRAIGFSKYKFRNQLEDLYWKTMFEPDRKINTIIGVNSASVQFEKDFCPNMGLAIIGEYNEGKLSIEHHFPYIKGVKNMVFENISIEKQTDKESYAGICEDTSLGMSLIFYLQNIAGYAKSKWLNYSNKSFNNVVFSALSIDGVVILGMKKDAASKNQETIYKKRRNSLLKAAQKGDMDAIENLTIDEMDLYTMISLRIRHEDMFSIVDTSFMPCGVECDHYMIVGNILSVHTEINSITNEKIYNIMVEANYILLNIGINSLDLQGEPKVGRRFRGEIWLQGYVKI